MNAAIYARMLLATLGLLTLVTSASAECAWVLWREEAPSGSGRWNLDTGMQIAFHTQAECEQQTKARLAFLTQSDPRPGSPAFLACLPDTIDPRGPKGSP